MKKAKTKIFGILLVLVLVVIFPCGCSHSVSNSSSVSSASDNSSVSDVSSASDNSSASDVSSVSGTTIVVEDTDIDATSIPLSAEELISSYCSHEWNGEYLAGNEIKTGILYMDGVSTNSIADMGPYENESSFYGYRIIGQTDKGTLVFDTNAGNLEWWKYGIRLEKHHCNLEYWSKIYYDGEKDIIITKTGQNVEIYTSPFKALQWWDNVIDMYYDGVLYYISTFDRENLAITADGQVSALSSHYVRFPRKQSKSPDISGPNCYIGKNHTFFIDSDEMILFEHDEDEKMIAQLPKGVGAELVWMENNQYIVAVYNDDGTYTICIVRDGKVETISNVAVDYNCAYDTLYFMEGDVVYAVNWKENSTPLVFFEGAYAVSPHIDEAEGAIVPSSEANWDGYGYECIYSPYGER